MVESNDSNRPSPPAVTPPKRLTRADIRRMGSGSSVAIGCTFVVLAIAALFLLVRGCLMG